MEKTTTIFTARRKLVLASASPRRIDFLARLGIECTVVPPMDQVEPLPIPGEAPTEFVTRAARVKAESVFMRMVDVPVLAADTVVYCGGTIYGKPRNADEAFVFLEALAGKRHFVRTACYLCVGKGRGIAYFGEAAVDMGDWPTAALQAYAETGEGLDKAGGYAFKGVARFW